MIEILKLSEDKLEILETPVDNCWINVISPTEEDIFKLKTIIDVPEETLLSLKDIDEIPVIEQNGKYTFIIIRTPYNNLDNELEYYTVPLGIFILENFVVTICYYENDTLTKLKSQRFPFRKTQLAFRLLLVSARLYLTYLKEINKKMYAIELELEKSQKNRIIMQLLEIEKSLVYFNTSLKSNEILIERIAKDSILIKTNEDKALIEDVMDENKQAIEMTNIYSDILSNTLDAFASLISNNLNIVMKLLASITIVLSLPTLVASVYGMNIELPFQHSPQAFSIVMTFSFLLSIICVVLFWKKNFF